MVTVTVAAPVVLVVVAVAEIRSVPRVVVKRSVLLQQFVWSVPARQQYTPGSHCSTFQVVTFELPAESVVANKRSGVSLCRARGKAHGKVSKTVGGRTSHRNRNADRPYPRPSCRYSRSSR